MWWQQAVFYEIYIRSFQDSDADGIGDLEGISSRLDYLADLGIDAVWVTPFYPSPQIDFGYDVSNHEAVDPQFGTLASFDRLLASAHARGIRVIVDLVLNHTSDQHAWFLESQVSRASPFREWYVWRDGEGPGQPPNNWESAFGGPAWTFDERTDQWYYHHFYSAQPDLNWRNPQVEERMFAVAKFWLDRGVDGFRLDAVDALFEDPNLGDNPPLPEPRVTLTGVRTQEFLRTRRQPEIHGVLQRLRRYVERHSPECVLISEAYVDGVRDLVRFYGNDDEVHLPFNFSLAQVRTLDARAFIEATDRVHRAFGPRWPSLVLNNHDIARASDRYTGGRDGDAVSKVLAAMLLTLRGTPFLYYGEEIGMRTVPPERLELVRDPVGRRFWPGYKGRDGVRRPMPWNGHRGAGFSRADPWLPLAPDSGERNVATQREEPGSILNFYRGLVRLRRRREALRTGDYRLLPSGEDVFGFIRKAPGDEVGVVLNMCGEARAAQIDSSGLDRSRVWRVGLGTHRNESESVDFADLRLHAYEALILTSDD